VASSTRFTLSRAKLLRTNVPVLAVPATESPLDAVRKSFVERLGENDPETAVAAAPLSIGSLPIFAGAADRAPSGGQDLRAAAYQAALSSSRTAVAVALPSVSSRPKEASARIPVVRQLGTAPAVSSARDR
jgi:hypothetical protein